MKNTLWFFLGVFFFLGMLALGWCMHAAFAVP
jgi:hypothetical protein